MCLVTPHLETLPTGFLCGTRQGWPVVLSTLGTLVGHIEPPLVHRVCFSSSWQKHLNELLGEVRTVALSFWTGLEDIKTALWDDGGTTRGTRCCGSRRVGRFNFPNHRTEFWVFILHRNPLKGQQRAQKPSSTSDLPPPFSRFAVDARSKGFLRGTRHSEHAGTVGVRF